MAVFGNKQITQLQKELAELKKAFEDEQIAKQQLQQRYEELQQESHKAHQGKSEVEKELEAIKSIIGDEKNKYKKVAALMNEIDKMEGKSAALIQNLILSQERIARLVQKAKMMAVYVMAGIERAKKHEMISCSESELSNYLSFRSQDMHFKFSWKEDEQKHFKNYRALILSALKTAHATYYRLNELEKLADSEKINLDTMDKYEVYFEKSVSRSEKLLRESLRVRDIKNNSFEDYQHWETYKLNPEVVAMLKNESIQEKHIERINYEMGVLIKQILRSILDIIAHIKYAEEELEQCNKLIIADAKKRPDINSFFGSENTYEREKRVLQGIRERTKKLAEVVAKEMNKSEELIEHFLKNEEYILNKMSKEFGIVFDTEISLAKAVEAKAKREIKKERQEKKKK